METTPESPAPSTEELAELESEFARLETELAALDDADETPPVATAHAETGEAKTGEGGEG